MRNIFNLLALLVLLFGCASTPVFDTAQLDRTLTPETVVAQPGSNLGKQVLWGGIILNTQNLRDATQIEILAYPLDDLYRPVQDKSPLGRFILIHEAFLEPTTYSQGKLLTVAGKVGSSQQGSVGESGYTYPVVVADKIQIWSPRNDSGRTSFHFGIGIGL